MYHIAILSSKGVLAHSKKKQKESKGVSGIEPIACIADAYESDLVSCNHLLFSRDRIEL